MLESRLILNRTHGMLAVKQHYKTDEPVKHRT